MTGSIAFLADTHAGAGPAGFQQQPRRMDLAPAAFAGLSAFARNQRLDLVVHGGDLTEHGSRDEISQALDLLGGLGVPSAYCLGNHDLAEETSFGMWREMAHPPGVSRPFGVIALNGMDVIPVNNGWAFDGGEGYVWKPQPGGLQERLLRDQLEGLDRILAGNLDRPAAVVIHTPPDPIPARLSGQPGPIHGAYAPYVEAVTSLLDRHSRVKLLLNGHNHATVATRQGGRLHLTVSALVEAPFEFRVIRWAARSLSVETVAAMPTPPDAAYDAQRAWVNGQPEDRTATLSW